jgi:3-dehydroquinate dehydratase-2
MKILLINGPNLNLLGTREPAKYGHTTLAEVERQFTEEAQRLGAQASCFQSNHEGAIVDRIHAARTEGMAGIVINAGAYTHTSIAIRDALAGTAIPFAEIHISNVHAREPFRHASYLSETAAGIVVGFGVEGYVLALRGLVKKLGS